MQSRIAGLRMPRLLWPGVNWAGTAWSLGCAYPVWSCPLRTTALDGLKRGTHRHISNGGPLLGKAARTRSTPPQNPNIGSPYIDKDPLDRVLITTTRREQNNKILQNVIYYKHLQNCWKGGGCSERARSITGHRRLLSSPFLLWVPETDSHRKEEKIVFIYQSGQILPEKEQKVVLEMQRFLWTGTFVARGLNRLSRFWQQRNLLHLFDHKCCTSLLPGLEKEERRRKEGKRWVIEPGKCS